MSESTADIIARLSMRLQPHAASPVTVRRLASDSPPPAGVRDGYGKPNTLSSRRRGGRYPNTYRPNARDFAGSAMVTPPTMRPSSDGDVKPAGGIRLGDDKSLEAARSLGEDNGYRAWTSARVNVARDAGDVLPAGTSYPSGRTRSGNLSPSARY